LLVGKQRFLNCIFSPRNWFRLFERSIQLEKNAMWSSTAIIVFSHLRWEFVYQRPQHLLSRLAEFHRIIFIEEPEFAPASAKCSWRYSLPTSNVLVCRPCTHSQAPGFHREQLPHLSRLLSELLERERLTDYVLWFYTPMAEPLADELKPLAVVYDCMDELSAFLNAPPQLLEREIALLQRADIVFTGGPSLYRAKKNRHPKVYCEPSSVDARHFGQAADSIGEAADQQALPHPRLGYFGVIDERIDLALLDQMAGSHPEWQIVMVGPVVKIDPATLPRRANITYFGQRKYEELPSYLKGWDVCLLPFARNESTKYISPTKILEYMAAKKQIASTPITDVAEPYGDIVYLGETNEDFIASCERALHAPAQERAQRQNKMAQVLKKTSWNATANRMRGVLTLVMENNRERRESAAGRLHAATANPTEVTAV
jgi:UDP-galactopyranose mutase